MIQCVVRLYPELDTLGMVFKREKVLHQRSVERLYPVVAGVVQSPWRVSELIVSWERECRRVDVRYRIRDRLVPQRMMTGTPGMMSGRTISCSPTLLG